MKLALASCCALVCLSLPGLPAMAAPPRVAPLSAGLLQPGPDLQVAGPKKKAADKRAAAKRAGKAKKTRKVAGRP